jgi:hypothetical protein
MYEKIPKKEIENYSINQEKELIPDLLLLKNNHPKLNICLE